MNSLLHVQESIQNNGFNLIVFVVIVVCFVGPK